MSLLSGRYQPLGVTGRSIFRPFGLAGLGCGSFLIALLVLGHVVLTHFFWQLQSSFAIAELELGPNQPTVFFKRENWGIVGNGEDSGLTLTPGRCTSVYESSDYTFVTYMENIVYRWDGTTLHLYEGEDAPRFPLGPDRFPFPVVRHRRAPWGSGSKQWLQRVGAVRLHIEHNPTPCLSYWESMIPGLKTLKLTLGIPTEI